MAPIKFEENIREKLQERELTPSKAAWNKLASQLEEQPQKKNNNFIWFAVAASLVGVLLMTTILLNNTNLVAEGQIVEEKVREQKEQPLQEPIIKEPLFEEPVKETAVVFNVSSEKSNHNEVAEVDQMSESKFLDTITTTKVKISETTLAKNELEESLIKERKSLLQKEVEDIDAQNTAVSTVVVKSDLENTPLENNEELFINKKIDEVVASIKEKNNKVTPEEIDALLAKAQREISTNRILQQAQYKVDATALLNDVETDLERSFRDKVFDALGDGYHKVRTAVVERNN